MDETKTQSQDQQYPFVAYLESLRDRGDRGALAALRRGLGQTPGTAPSMYQYVVPWVWETTPSWVEDTYYTIASLFASHPRAGGTGNMGAHFARLRDAQGSNVALERRFSNLLRAQLDNLADPLRYAVGYLKSKNIPINWTQLFFDMIGWGHPDRYVQTQWARAFWGRRSTETKQPAEQSA
jgi:CRISPR system Cascade subunit CasB